MLPQAGQHRLAVRPFYDGVLGRRAFDTAKIVILVEFRLYCAMFFGRFVHFFVRIEPYFDGLALFEKCIWRVKVSDENCKKMKSVSR